MGEKISQSLFGPMRSKLPINLLERIAREAEKLEDKHLDREDWEEAGNLIIDVLYYMTICRPGQAKGDLGFLRAMLKEIRRQASSHVKEEGRRPNERLKLLKSLPSEIPRQEKRRMQERRTGAG